MDTEKLSVKRPEGITEEQFRNFVQNVANMSRALSRLTADADHYRQLSDRGMLDFFRKDDLCVGPCQMLDNLAQQLRYYEGFVSVTDSQAPYVALKPLVDDIKSIYRKAYNAYVRLYKSLMNNYYIEDDEQTENESE